MLFFVHVSISYIYKGWDDTVTIGTLSIQKSTDTYRYSHHARTSGSIISHFTFIQLIKRLKHFECDLNYFEHT